MCFLVETSYSNGYSELQFNGCFSNDHNVLVVSDHVLLHARNLIWIVKVDKYSLFTGRRLLVMNTLEEGRNINKRAL